MVIAGLIISAIAAGMLGWNVHVMQKSGVRYSAAIKHNQWAQVACLLISRNFVPCFLNSLRCGDHAALSMVPDLALAD